MKITFVKQQNNQQNLKLNLTLRSKFKVHEKNIQKLCDVMCNVLEFRKVRQKKLLKLSELTCVFLTALEMKILNQSFRKKNKPTDVLSFQPLDSNSMGELVFCPEVLVRQAKKQKHSLSHEFAYMFIHGLLHLLDYDHEISEKEEKIMFTLQDLIFRELTENKLALKSNLNYLSLLK